MSAAPTPFCYRLRVRYAECDAQKVVFNARYGLYADLAFTEFLRALALADQLIHGAYDVQLVQQTTQWKAPARFDDVLAVSVSVTRMGTTSFAVICHVDHADTHQQIAIIDTTYVLMDAALLQKVALPDDIRARFAEGAQGRWIDHANSTVQVTP